MLRLPNVIHQVIRFSAVLNTIAKKIQTGTSAFIFLKKINAGLILIAKDKPFVKMLTYVDPWLIVYHHQAAVL